MEDDDCEKGDRGNRRAGSDYIENCRCETNHPKHHAQPAKALAKGRGPEHGHPQGNETYCHDKEPYGEQRTEYAPDRLPHKGECRLLPGGCPGSVIEVGERGGSDMRESSGREHDEVRDLGGLYVLGTERHESRRIDNQLRGRSGRQGDPGESRFYLSLGDDLMRLFKAQMVERVMSMANVPDDVPIENKMVTRAIASAQSQVETQNFETRKNVLKYDEVLNRQREVIYGERRRVLEGEDLHEQVRHMIGDVVGARHEVLLLEPVDDVRDRRQGHPERFGDVAHVTAGVIADVEQHLRLREHEVQLGRALPEELAKRRRAERVQQIEQALGVGRAGPGRTGERHGG